MTTDPAIEVATRVYHPHHHFWPLPAALYVPQWFLLDAYLSPANGEAWVVDWGTYQGRSVGKWVWQHQTFEEMLNDKHPWRFAGDYSVLDDGKVRYHPGPEEDPDGKIGDILYLVTSEVIETRGEGKLLVDASWRRKIVRPD